MTSSSGSGPQWITEQAQARIELQKAFEED